MNREDLKTLLSPQQRPCVSIFLPTHRAGREIRQDSIRLKNLIRDAEDRLSEGGLRGPDAKDLLKAAHALVDDAAFWRHQSDGLVLFLAPDLFRVYRLPITFNELVVVADRFHVKPLLPFFTEDTRFYILALSHHERRLLQCTRQTVGRMDLPEAPERMTDTPGYEKPETQLQLQAIAPPGQSGSGIVHGHGSSTDASADDLLRYFRQIEKAVQNVLKDEQAPLVLAGVEYLLPLYRQVNTYHRLMDEGLTGNQEGARDEELQQRGWELIEPVLQKARDEAAGQLQQAVNTGRGSDKLLEVAPAAAQGRVALLFVPVGVQQWGRFDERTQTVQVHHEEEAGDEDLINLCVIQTILHGGKVYAVSPHEMPTDGAAAAVFRY
ncbi:MAG: hypothetical protein ICV76_07930 [Nitrospiraceae bacterium]|nr:hypothetical protein [Nitrospiraceae bacterium]